MAIIASASTYIREEDVEYKRSVSENILTKVGASINFILDNALYQSSRAEIFTSSDNFTVPTGVTRVKVTVVGGGGGAGYGGAGLAGGGGGGGGYAIEWLTGLTPAAVIAVTIGAAGALPGADPGDGSAGGTSSFGAYCQATGGAGGKSDGSLVAGGVGSGGSINGNGGYGYSVGAGTGAGATSIGVGGSSILGAGGVGNTTVAGYGSGGGSGLGGGGGGGTARAGTAGVVIVEYNY